MKRFLFVLLLSVITKVAFPQAQYVSFRIDSAVRAAIEAHHIPGLQIAVVKYGLVLKKANYGYENLEDRVPVSDSTKFSIASMSKAFTCAGILLLMEDGKLSIDDSVGKYLDSLPASWSGITLRMLMDHSSGLRDDWDNKDDIFFYTHDTDSSFLAAFKTEPLKFRPGQGSSYSCGSFLLGLVIAKVSGESYPDFMKHRIFDKLGMTNSCINEADSIISNRAAGYIWKDQKIMHGRQISAAAQARGDVGVLTTLSDMLKWYTALQDTSLLKQISIDLMFSPGLLNDSSKIAYGLGWYLGPFRDHALISHTGAFRTGYNSVMDMYPEDHVGIIILSNLQEAHMNQLAKNIVGLFDPAYAVASQMLRDSTDTDSVRTLLLKSDFTEFGLNIDTTRKMINALHVPFYFENDNDLAMFRNVTEFNFIRAIKPSKPKPDIFGDTIQGIYLYEVKCKDQPTRYFAFFLDPTGKLVYLDLEE